MTTSRHLAVSLIFLLPGLLAGAQAASARQPSLPALQSRAGEQIASSSTPDSAKDTEAYYDFSMGHYYAQRYQVTSQSEDANKDIDFYKKAFVLDSGSQQIGDELAEIYFQSQHIRDAVTEAQSMLAKDPENLGAHRLLARIYIRTLGDMSNTAGQHDTLVRASEQYAEILRLDPTDTDAALWLARLYRLQNEHDKAETVLRALLAREPENENGVEQLTQLLLDEGKSQEAVSSLQGILQRAPTASLWDMLGAADTQIHDLPNAEQAYRKASEIQPDEISHRRGLAQALLAEEKFPEALEEFQRLSQMDADDPDNYLRLAEIY
jgi:predicted Zn-dependent protease